MLTLTKRTLGIVAVVLVCTLVAFGDSPKTLNYQGYLTDASGKPLPSNNYSLTFRLYGASTGGSALWTEAQTAGVINGLFNVILGKTTPIGLTFDTTYYMSIQVGTDPEMSPRIEMTSVSYSFYARAAKPSGPAGGDMTGSYPNPSIANNAVTSAKILDGTIVNADISATAAIAVSKIFGDAGVGYFAWGGAYYGVAANDATIHDMGSMTIAVPASGYVLVVLSGNVIYMGDNKTIYIGLNTVNTALSASYEVNTGRLDGSGTLRFNDPFTAIAAIPVSAGNVTIYALAQGNTTFGAGNANVVPQMMFGIFIPKHY